MQRILLAAFMRGIGGGLALAATPYLLALGVRTLRLGARGTSGLRAWAQDVSDVGTYYHELRTHRRQTRQPPMHPEAGLDLDPSEGA